MWNTNSPAVESSSGSYTEKVSNSKKNTTRTKRKKMHNVLFLGIIWLHSSECIHAQTKLGINLSSKYVIVPVCRWER
jgi:hypothetical protein